MNKQQTINTPKGGGSLTGLGETFRPDLHTGTGNFSIPISIPPGRNGFQPELNLVYSTGNGNGPFGLGWQLSIPGVERKTSKGIPRYRDSDINSGKPDTFILSGAEDLIPVEKGNNYVKYRPRTEGLFAQVYRIRNEENDYWEVKSKNGLTSRYGSVSSRSNDLATIRNPENTDHVFAWKLSRTEDPFGNSIAYSYLRDEVIATESATTLYGKEKLDSQLRDQLYIDEINYINHDEGDQSDNYLVNVKFLYEERDDPFSVFTAGFQIRTRLRCNRIEVRVNASQEMLVRAYDLRYISEPYSLISLLSEVLVTGYDENDNTENLPPLSFNYTSFDPIGRDFFPIQGELPFQAIGSAGLELVDLYGNGLPDIVQMNGGPIRYWRNLGNGTFDLPRNMNEAPIGLSLEDPNVQFMDINGEGKADLVVNNSELSGYFPTTFDAKWDIQSFQKFDTAPSFNLATPEVKLVDLDGDGMTDILRTGTYLELFFNDPEQGWGDVMRVNRGSLPDFPDVNFSDPRIRLADMTGDGLQDIVMIHDGNIEYWPYMGYGKWGKRVHMQGSPNLPYGYDPKRILVGDIAGKGPNDIIYVDNHRVFVWINQNGNGFSDQIEINGTPSITDMDHIRLVDILGNGINGILWTANKIAPNRNHYYFLDFTGGMKPFLLNEMDNHMGALTKINYRPSTFFYIQDEQRSYTRWKTTLPFPVHVVDRVEVIDAISRGKLTTEYSYHHGYWDGAEREFRGFGRVEQKGTEVFDDYRSEGMHENTLFEDVDHTVYTPPILTKTWFHQGPIGPEFGDWDGANQHELFADEFWEGDRQKLLAYQELTDYGNEHDRRRTWRDAIRTLRGSVLRTEVYALDNTLRSDRPYTVTENQYGIREEFATDNPPLRGMSGHIFFSFVTAQRTTQWERGDDPMTQISFSSEYDAFGQLKSQTSIACPQGWRELEDIVPEGSPFLSTHNETVHAFPIDEELPKEFIEVERDYMPNVYIKDRVAKSTTFEIENDGAISIESINEASLNPEELIVIAQALNYYDGPAFTGLDFGEIGEYGALVRSESLVLTPQILEEAYNDAEFPIGIPEYLTNDNSFAWTSVYPDEFRAFIESLPGASGYIFYEGDGEQARGYFVQSTKIFFDFQETVPVNPKGLPIINRDPIGTDGGERDTIIQYDDYQLLPVRVETPLGLETTANYNYRVMQPESLIDPNGNSQVFSFSPLGLVQSIAIIDKNGEGDSLDFPSTRFEYDFLAFEEREEPVSVKTIQREHHINEPNVSPDNLNNTIITKEFSDGFGRLIQTRTQAEDVLFGDDHFGNGLLPEDANVAIQPAVGRERERSLEPVEDERLMNTVVSGWQVYDNKGQVVEKFEPFYDMGFDYETPADEKFGTAVRMFYDPRGQVIRTMNPDGSEQRVIYGIPEPLEQLDNFTPTPWIAFTYDANDLAPLSKNTNGDSLTNKASEHHWFTPSHIEIDALGRTVRAVERNRLPNEDIEEYVTTSEYDIRGNLIEVIDASGRSAFRYVYDLANQNLYTHSIDAGQKATILDAMGNPLETRDRKGAIILSQYDELNRPTRLWARDNNDQAVSLRQLMIYAERDVFENPNITTPEPNNLRGQLLYHYDEAGLLRFHAFDFKGNLLEKSRRVISDATIRQVFENAAATSWNIQPFTTQWEWEDSSFQSLEVYANSILEAREYMSSMLYDALNRVKQMTYPEDADRERKTLLPEYNRAGALKSIRLSSPSGADTARDYVRHIAYNARGQRTMIAYGNRLMTRYTYDNETFRLKRIRSQRFEFPLPDENTYRPNGRVLQDMFYEYDLVGNITDLLHRAPNSGTPPNLTELHKTYEYDAIYRLTRADGGREHTMGSRIFPWEDAPVLTDFNQTRTYDEEYTYDPMGNMLELVHHGGSGGFTREYRHQTENNQLIEMQIGSSFYRYDYDLTGNMTQEGHNRFFTWNHSNQLKAFHNQTENAQPTVYAHYLYDATGQRIKKIVRLSGGQYRVTIYIDGLFEMHREISGSETQENNSLHIMDDQQRVAILRIGEPLGRDIAPPILFHLSDYLGSSHVVVDWSWVFINHEEYSPYGETVFGSFSWKRYRYSGKEKDEESGLCYYGLRFYCPVKANWLTPDPAGIVDSFNLFKFVRNNPINLFDSKGLLANSPNDSTKSEIMQKVENKAFQRFDSSFWTSNSSIYDFTPNLVTRLPDMYETVTYAWVQPGATYEYKNNRTYEGEIKIRLENFEVANIALMYIFDPFYVVLLKHEELHMNISLSVANIANQEIASQGRKITHEALKDIFQKFSNVNSTLQKLYDVDVRRSNIQVSYTRQEWWQDNFESVVEDAYQNVDNIGLWAEDFSKKHGFEQEYFKHLGKRLPVKPEAVPTKSQGNQQSTS